MMEVVWVHSIILLVFLVQPGSLNLVVNIKATDGDVVQKDFFADPEKDYVTIEYMTHGSRYVRVYIDFRLKRKVFQVVVLGEMDKAESSYEAMCFVTELVEEEMISSDSMSKLRQKNPSTIRVPEEDLGSEPHKMDHVVYLDSRNVTDEKISELCKDAGKVLFEGTNPKLLLKELLVDVRFAQDENRIKYLMIICRDRNPENSTREDLDKLELASQDQSGLIKVLKGCKDTSELSSECVCRTEVCISWYPCQLKLCQGKNDDGQPMEYRCGIKTCGKCYLFDFYVTERRQCFWDVNS